MSDAGRLDDFKKRILGMALASPDHLVDVGVCDPASCWGRAVRELVSSGTLDLTDKPNVYKYTGEPSSEW